MVFLENINCGAITIALVLSCNCRPFGSQRGYMNIDRIAFFSQSKVRGTVPFMSLIIDFLIKIPVEFSSRM